MFLEAIKRRNQKLIEVAIQLHQAGKIPANSYVLDVDTISQNARYIITESSRYRLKAFAMTKQFGRNPVILKKLKAAGFEGCVAVDMQCARPVQANGLKVSHLGHLVQVPKAETRVALNMKPDYWTVFSHEKASHIADALKAGETQKIMARIVADGDLFYKGHGGGFEARDIKEVSDRLSTLPGLQFSGITTFPAQLFDEATKTVYHTPNYQTLLNTANQLQQIGLKKMEVNAPGTTSSLLFKELAEAGVTQVEPGHGLTGTVPLNAFTDLAEVPAMLYVTEVSHFYEGKPYCFGGGMYIDPLFKPYDVKAYVGATPEEALKQKMSCDMPEPSAIDYYGILNPEAMQQVRTGDTVVFGFRAQTFVTRAYMVPVSGISKGLPVVEGFFTTDGREVGWPEWK